MTPPRLTRDMQSEINRTAYRATQLAYAELRRQMQAAALQAIAEGRDWDECLTIGAVNAFATLDSGNHPVPHAQIKSRP